MQAGTLSGNPLAMAAGVATLRTLIEGRETIYADLERKTAALADGLGAAAATTGVPMTCNRVGSMLTGFFAEGPIENAADLAKASKEQYARVFHAMLAAGIAFAPSYCEAAFVSTAHTDEDIARTVEAAGQAFRLVR